MSAGPLSWEDLNQRFLMAALRELKARLEAFLSTRGTPAIEPAPKPAPTPMAGELALSSAPPALERLCDAFSLSQFERAIVLLCAGVELDAEFASLCARADKVGLPTFGLALAALPEPHWSAITPAGSLRRWRLIDILAQAGKPMLASGLRIDERILHFLAGIQYLDERVDGMVEPVAVEEMSSSQQALVESIASTARQALAVPGELLPIIQLCGADEQINGAVAAAAARALGLGLITVWAENLPMPANSAEIEMILRLSEREAMLTGSLLCVNTDGLDRSDHRRAAQITRLLERVSGVVFLNTHDRWRPLRRLVHSFDVRKPSSFEQAALWQTLLEAAGAQVNGAVPHLTAQFNLNANEIRASVQLALASESAPDELATRLWDAGRSQARPRLDDLAQQLEPSAHWPDLVLPQAEKSILAEIASHVAHRHVVYQEWGFAAAGNRGLGISALFAGATGTGKTMAADVLAHELRLDLYRIDLSSVVSKYIGETEKNLRRVFDAAEDGGAILFFDEADALFGKRTEVKDSHDRYSNVEINYLLQRMECYTGLSILATNMKASLDTAFLRRLRFVINFPFPDAVARATIWERIFPKATPTDGLDIATLARLNVSGGNIRNIAMNAAFLAVKEGEPVRMGHIVRAARSEYAKMERPLTEFDLRGLQ